MKRLVGVAIAVLVLPAASAHAATTHTIAVSDDLFTPADLQILVGDTVRWSFAQSASGNHNIATKAGQAESFNTDPGVPPALIHHDPSFTFDYTFNKDNVAIDYVCEVHPIQMQGTITVGAPPVDTGPPVVSGTKATVRKKRIKIAFELDEKAKIVLRVARASKPKKALRIVKKTLTAGDRSISVRRGGLPAGRYRVTITAEDEAGNESKAYKARFRIKPS